MLTQASPPGGRQRGAGREVPRLRAWAAGGAVVVAVVAAAGALRAASPGTPVECRRVTQVRERWVPVQASVERKKGFFSLPQLHLLLGDWLVSIRAETGLREVGSMTWRLNEALCVGTEWQHRDHTRPC